MAVEFKQVYLEAGEQFVGRSVMLTVGESKDIKGVTAEFEFAISQNGLHDHQFGGDLVGYMRKTVSGDHYTECPIWLEPGTDRFYHIVGSFVDERVKESANEQG